LEMLLEPGSRIVPAALESGGRSKWSEKALIELLPTIHPMIARSAGVSEQRFNARCIP
jgi:hypothetical protein